MSTITSNRPIAVLALPGLLISGCSGQMISFETNAEATFPPQLLHAKSHIDTIRMPVE